MEWAPNISCFMLGMPKKERQRTPGFTGDIFLVSQDAKLNQVSFPLVLFVVIVIIIIHQYCKLMLVFTAKSEMYFLLNGG